MSTSPILSSTRQKKGDIEDQLSHLSNDDSSNSNNYHQERYNYGTEKKGSISVAPKDYAPQASDESKDATVTDNPLLFDTSQLVHTITTNDSEPDIIYIDNKKFYKQEVMQAFGGSLVPGYQPRSIYDFANPAPLGLCAFALTTFVSSLVDLEADSVTNSTVVVGLALFYGGFIQFIAGMWSIASRNAFGGTALSSFGGFWMAWGILRIDFFGIRSSYETEEEYSHALGLFYLGWTIFSYIITLLTFKSTLAFFSLFCFVCMTYTLTTIAKFTMSLGVQKAAGVFGVITAFIAWYNAFSGLATKENSYFVANVLQLPDDIFHNNHPHSQHHKHK